MTDDLREAIRQAVVETIKLVGLDTFKRMSWFGSNDPAFRARRFERWLKDPAVREALHRKPDESRFRYLKPEGKARLRADASNLLSVKTSFERAQEAATRSAV